MAEPAVRIRNPDPGPIDPPPPEPVEVPIPRMTVHRVSAEAPVRRVQASDIDGLVETYGPLLREKWKRCDDSVLKLWFRQAISERDIWFFVAPKVLGMFHVEHTPLEPSARLVETFTRKSKGATNDEQVEFYRFIVSLAQSAKIVEVNFNIDSNCAMYQSTKGKGVTSEMQDQRIGWYLRERRIYSVVFNEDS